MLTIRDLQSQEQFAVPPEGAVLGREGGGADIVVRDKSVSKRHAKVYERGGKWFLEDLQSANGTYVDEQPVTRPVGLKQGMSFSLSNYHFEVMPESQSAPTRARGAPPPPPPAAQEDWDADGGYPDETAPPPEDEWAPDPSASKGNRSGPAGGKKSASPPKANGSSKSQPKGGGKTAPKGGGGSSSAGAGGDAGGVLAQIPKAIAHYMKSVPIFVVNPLGFIKGSIEDMKYPAMKPMELLPWGLVAALFNVGLGIGAGAVSTVTSMIQTKAFDGGPLIALVVGSAVGIVIAVVIAIVSAFIFHPLMGFIIKLLKGESDEVNRSNYYVCVMTAYILMGLPAAGAGIAAVFGLIPVVGKFAAVLPLAASLIAQFYLLLVAYFWMKYFQVMKWVPIVILVLAGLSAVMGLLGVVNVARGILAGGGGVATGLTAEQQAALAAQQALNGGVTPTPGTSTGDDDDADPTPGGTSGSTTSATPAPTATLVAAVSPRPGSLSNTPKPVATPGGSNVSVAPIAGGLTPYQRWAAKRDAVEKAIADDPTILKRDKDLYAGYQQYHRAAFNVKQKWAKVSKDPSQGPVNQRMIDAETFELTGPLIDQLYARISK